MKLVPVLVLVLFLLSDKAFAIDQNGNDTIQPQNLVYVVNTKIVQKYGIQKNIIIDSLVLDTIAHGLGFNNLNRLAPHIKVHSKIWLKNFRRPQSKMMTQVMNLLYLGCPVISNMKKM